MANSKTQARTILSSDNANQSNQIEMGHKLNFLVYFEWATFPHLTNNLKLLNCVCVCVVCIEQQAIQLIFKSNCNPSNKLAFCLGVSALKCNFSSGKSYIKESECVKIMLRNSNEKRE